jgi:hypothetical protein
MKTKSTIRSPRELILYTSRLGIIFYQLAILRYDMDFDSWIYIELGKYSKYDIVFNIKSKHSNIKVYLHKHKYRFSIFKGTRELFQITELNITTIKSINNLNYV